MPKVTVLMTVYNMEKYLRTAIFSILNQSFSDFELIIIDDGSRDGTEQIIKSFHDSRIRYFKNRKNLGISKSANKGINLARGEYVARMDGDDISRFDRLEKQVTFLDNHKDHGLLGSWYYVVDENGSLLSATRKHADDKSIRLSMIFENQFLQSSIMMRTTILKELMYDHEFEVCEDYDLWCRFLTRTKVANLTDELVTYRWHGTNTSMTKQKMIVKSFVSIFARTFDELQISYDVRELFIHSSLTLGYFGRIYDDSNKIQEIERWLDKMENSRPLLAVFDKKAIKQKIDIIRKSVPKHVSPVIL